MNFELTCFKLVAILEMGGISLALGVVVMTNVGDVLTVQLLMANVVVDVTGDADDVVTFTATGETVIVDIDFLHLCEDSGLGDERDENLD